MTATDTTAETRQTLGTRVSFSDPLFGEVYDFLTEEAALLDHDNFHDWLALIAPDITYRMPARETLYRRDGDGIDENGGQFQDDYMALTLRVRRNADLKYAWDRDPPPRIRRFVTNVAVYRTDTDTEFRANSYILLLRNQFDLTTIDLLSGERQDLVRKTEEGFRLARRRILIDMCTLPDPIPNVFF